MAKAPLRIADALGFGGGPKPYSSPYLREVSKIKRGQKLPGTITRAPRPSAATELAQLLTPNTRFGNELAAKIAPAVDVSPLGILTGLVDARRAYQAGNTGNAAGLGILAALGAIPAAGELKPLTKSQFAKEYMQHVDLRGRAGDAAKRMEKIIKEGFEPGFGPNLLPVWMGGQPKNIMEQKFLPRSGDIVYLVPKSGREKTSGGAFRISKGWKPEPFETVKLTDDFSDIYSEYLKAFIVGE